MAPLAEVAGVDMSRGSVRERVDRAVAVTVTREMDRMERWMVFLASVGSTAPFVGLFGTVWGIMRSFSAIAVSKNTNLSVVAPGIAEALFATAIGLVAAIPAVLAYNKLSTDLSRFAARLEGFGTEFGAILSRQAEGQAGSAPDGRRPIGGGAAGAAATARWPRSTSRPWSTSCSCC